jgi:serine O-acetyltransferase
LAKLTRSLSDITRTLLDSYEELGGINHIGGASLPSRTAIEDMLGHFDTLVFPGFHREENLSPETLEYVTGHKVANLFDLVRDLGYRNFLHDAREAGDDVKEDELRERAREFAFGFLNDIPRLRYLLALDVDALHEGDPAARTKEEVILSYPGLQAILVHRVAHCFWQQDAGLIARMMSELIHARTGVDIHPGATIGKSFHIDHGTGVVIGETSVIGDHVKIYQGVTLGGLSVQKKLQDEKRHPTLEDHVTVYAGATILGGQTTVGHHSVVGGNVWLIKSVPAWSIVENDPRVRVRGRKGVDDGYWEI